jgi:hypothetical protein
MQSKVLLWVFVMMQAVPRASKGNAGKAAIA